MFTVVRSACFATAFFRLNWCMQTQASCVPAGASRLHRKFICTSTRVISGVLLMDNGGCYRIGRKRRAARDTHWKTEQSSRECFLKKFVAATFSVLAVSFGSNATCCSVSPRPEEIVQLLSCLRPDRTT